MKKTLTTFFIILLTLSLQAQHTISGTFSPAEAYTWLIVYRLKPGTQVYVADTSIKGGKFSLTMPKDAVSGTYRMVYAVPQEEFYFDIIYDGKEDIELSFNSVDGARYTKSKENIILSEYYISINDAKQKVIDFYVAEKKNKKTYSQLTKSLESIQKNYEKESNGLISNHFVIANKPSIPSKYSTIQDYIKHKKLNYFNYVDFKDNILLSSGFLSDKVTNYVFTALPLEELTHVQTQAEVIKNIEKTNYYTLGCSNVFRFNVYYTLWSQAVATDMNAVSDYVYTNFIKVLAKETNNAEIAKSIETHNRLRIGAPAPEIKLKDGTLSTLKNDSIQNYVLVFWSSTCSHCLKEIPKLHQTFKENKTTQVIAIGLEDDDVLWKQEIKRLPNFIHVISLEKWESVYAKTYNINSTPSYFVLDKNKNILVKPENYDDVVSFLAKK